MKSVDAKVTTATLAAFSDAWNRHDIDALMSFMSEDCVFQPAAGPQVCGMKYMGLEAVRNAFISVFKLVPDAKWTNGKHLVCGDFGVSLWTFTGTAADGSHIECEGVDVFTFKGDKIQLKNTFRKMRPNLYSRK